MEVEGEDEGTVHTGAETPSTTSQAADFEKSRQELLQLVRTALNESALSLDFASLLLSSMRPTVATTSLSPLLKQLVPVGSLSADHLYTNVPEEDHVIGAGWKVQALGTSSNQLEVAAQRLRGEIDKEEIYWNRILDTVGHGEVLFKIRSGDTRGLGVKYGYADSGSEYPDKGIAIVKRGPDGNPVFKFETPRTKSAVRITLYDMSSGEKSVIGVSSPVELLPEEAINAEIRNSRTLLFEEELFFEMVKEARLLASHKITVDNNRIVCTLFDEVLEIEYSEIRGAADESDPKISTRANCMATVFRLLLCYGHRRKLEKRQALPNPINTKIAPSSTRLFILRPLLAHLQHRKIVKRTRRVLEMILADQDGAELTVKTATTPSENPLPYLGRLLYPPRSSFTINTKSPPVTVTINTSSPLQSHIPLYEAVAVDESTGAMISRSTFYELSELEDWANWVLKRR